MIEFGDTFTVGVVLYPAKIGGIHTCDFCGYFTPYNEELYTYKMTHSGFGYARLSSCFSSSILINTKVRTSLIDTHTMTKDKVSTNLTSYTCQFCGKTFGRGDELSLHTKEEHSDNIGES